MTQPQGATPPDRHHWTVDVPTSLGPARWTFDAPVAADQLAGFTGPVLLLGHGAGGGIEAPDLVALAHGLPGLGVLVARLEQPWRVAGKKVAALPAKLDIGWLESIALVQDRYPVIAGAGPLVLGGRSAGARVACRTADDVGAAGVVCLAFPLHPPAGRPSRASELNQPGCPVLVLQGDRDPFGSGEAIRQAATSRVQVVDMVGSDHSLKVKAAIRTAAAQRQFIVDVVWPFMDSLIPASRS